MRGELPIDVQVHPAQHPAGHGVVDAELSGGVRLAGLGNGDVTAADDGVAQVRRHRLEGACRRGRVRPGGRVEHTQLALRRQEGRDHQAGEPLRGQIGGLAPRWRGDQTEPGEGQPRLGRPVRRRIRRRYGRVAAEPGPERGCRDKTTTARAQAATARTRRRRTPRRARSPRLTGRPSSASPRTARRTACCTRSSCPLTAAPPDPRRRPRRRPRQHPRQDPAVAGRARARGPAPGGPGWPQSTVHNRGCRRPRAR